MSFGVRSLRLALREGRSPGRIAAFGTATLGRPGAAFSTWVHTRRTAPPHPSNVSR